LISNCHVAGNWVGGIGIFGPEATGNTITATVGGSISSLHSSNLLAPGIPFAEFIFSPSPATSAPSFQVLDRNLANSSIFFTRLHAENPWESPAAGYLGGIVLHQAPGNIITECRVQGNGADGIRVIGDARDTILRANIAGSRLAPFSMRNSGNGIALECDHAVLEGNETHRNLRSGVLVRGVGNAVKGLRSSGNGECGIRCEGRQTMIGGTLFSDRAQIYSNPVGILLTSPLQPAPYVPGLNQVRGSLIGAEAPFGPGTPIPRPNLRGIHIMGSSGNRIGGRPLSSETNRIIYNQMEGVLVSSGTGNRLRGNFISGNGRLDIDLSGHSEGDGLDPPDPDDLDEGGNHKINSPILNQIVQSGKIVELTGNLTGAPPGIYELEIVIALPSSDLSGSHYSEILPLEHISPARPFAFTLQSAIDLRGTHIRASITDSSLNTSEYSNWIRIEGPRDTDADGISDSVETGSGPEDSNGDGIPDIRQAHVSSFPTLLTGGLSIAAPEGLSLDHISALSVSNLPPVTTQQFPYGVWEFSLGGLPDGGSASLAVLASQQDPAHGFYCFGPTPENPAPHWYDFSFDGTTGLQIIGDQIILSFVDGGRGDHDLTVNGRITSLGGSTNTLPPVPTPSFSNLSDGSVVISWPALPEAFRVVLQENPDPGQLPWNLNSAPVLESPVSSMVRVIPNRPGSLFRLLRP
ncbi:MAG: right-handed parallel beta-helix repeat-containing protein, partial [Verrucomicrobiota bacterium]|nr:right-handed parallel beta-helix repeat-containing protein [Verrucomicrobiota bacterium]